MIYLSHRWDRVRGPEVDVAPYNGDQNDVSSNQDVPGGTTTVPECVSLCECPLDNVEPLDLVLVRLILNPRGPGDHGTASGGY